MHRADRSPTADTALVTSTPCQRVSTEPCGDICQSGEAVSVRENRLSNCTPAQWDAIEARAVSCMRAQLVRYHRGGGMEQAADWERAKTAWALIVMNRERITRGQE